MPSQSSLFRRLMLGFSAVILAVAFGGMAYVLYDAKATQRDRTASENKAHARELLMHLVQIGNQPDKLRSASVAIEQVRTEMFHELDYHSRLRVRVWKEDQLLYNSQPDLPDQLPTTGSPLARHTNAWVQSVMRDDATGIAVERSHEVDDEWMLSLSGVTFLLSSTVFSLPLLLFPAWLIVGIGLRPLRSIADAIEQRAVYDLTPLADSKYRELSPLVTAINQLMARLRQRIENEHEFLTDAAHELKTPLAAIQLNAHLLQSSTASENPQRNAEVGAGLREGVARATHLVHQLLAFERARAEPDAEPLPPTNLDTVVRDRLAGAAPLAVQRGIDIEFYADEPCVMPIHLESMAALVDNLIGNAIKYSPQQGVITVRLVPLETGCRLTIADQGPGIDPHHRQRVFERFYRVPNQEQSGSGLGLAIAQRAAARNSATIALASGDDGRGLVVTIEFAL